MAVTNRSRSPLTPPRSHRRHLPVKCGPPNRNKTLFTEPFSGPIEKTPTNPAYRSPNAANRPASETSARREASAGNPGTKVNVVRPVEPRPLSVLWPITMSLPYIDSIPIPQIPRSLYLTPNFQNVRQRRNSLDEGMIGWVSRTNRSPSIIRTFCTEFSYALTKKKRSSGSLLRLGLCH